jgi:alkylation response protein AidB-like acyl-CoA dehydrogenase
MAYDYVAPLREMRFVIERVLDAPSSWRGCGAFADVDADTAGAVLEEAARFALEVLLPLNATGDVEACVRRADGSVTAPRGFREAYRAFVDAGWPALPCAPEWGGQGLPLLLDAALREMLDACNHAWTMYPDLLHGAYETIKAHAADALKARYLPKIASGEWLAAMALTEPQAGSDLGALRTRAEPQPDGSVRVTGQKIFISGGEHDLTDNIVHLVLCRLPDSPPGSKGLSLALVPKVLPDGTRNAMHCDGLEKKMGIKASATCAMRYEGAIGWLVGEPHRGLAAMFLMMNSARLHVGLQGLGHLEMATQNALRHAVERVQTGRPIARHPAVRHALLRLQALTEALRVVAYRAALALDEAAHHADAQRREREGRVAALLTPVVKAFCTHHGFHGASAALQVFGGYGYVHEYGIEQTVRDARIAMVYEGTNEIQAIDLVQRKLLADGGATWLGLLADFDAEAVRCDAEPGLGDFARALRGQTETARRAFDALAGAAADDREATLRLADDVLHGVAHTLLAWAFAASARAAVDEADAAWAQAKIARMRYGVQWLLPQAAVHWQRVQVPRMALPEVF